ncbi:Conserved hypothetical protein [Zobellia galactanivorans]|uniref:Uncharacterized protein n=1 Tax=Zobellia galactanivorans (strain DSM 12802 / CCUG 47099 / CIP 106680 / NCIMB 13871 / Dsij) TaxID=63186 RepID=G0LCL0_ZOBGA|nr:Conserved hypothetical protein [Zobellia galactanivorans]
MDIAEKSRSLLHRSTSFKNGVALLCQLVLKTDLEETHKWNFPTYTLDKKMCWPFASSNTTSASGSLTGSF